MTMLSLRPLLRLFDGPGLLLLLICTSVVGVHGSRLFDYSIQFDGCDGSAFSSTTQIECSYTVIPNVPENTRFELYAPGCNTNPFLVPREVTKAVETSTSLVIDIAPAAANVDGGFKFCIEYAIGTGGSYYRVNKRDITVNFILDGTFTVLGPSTIPVEVSQEVGEQESESESSPPVVDDPEDTILSYLSTFEVEATNCQGDQDGSPLPEDYELSSGDMLFVCIRSSSSSATTTTMFKIERIDEMKVEKVGGEITFEVISAGGLIDERVVTDGEESDLLMVSIPLGLDFFSTPGSVLSVTGTAIVTTLDEEGRRLRAGTLALTSIQHPDRILVEEEEDSVGEQLADFALLVPIHTNENCLSFDLMAMIWCFLTQILGSLSI